MNIENRQKHSTWTSSEYKNILKKHREGYKQSDIAREVGLTRERIRQVIKAAKRKELEAPDMFSELSSRLRNCLRGNSLYTIEAIKACIDEGKIFDIPNLGKKSIDELINWIKDK